MCGDTLSIEYDETMGEKAKQGAELELVDAVKYCRKPSMLIKEDK